MGAVRLSVNAWMGMSSGLTKRCVYLRVIGRCYGEKEIKGSHHDWEFRMAFFFRMAQRRIPFVPVSDFENREKGKTINTHVLLCALLKAIGYSLEEVLVKSSSESSSLLSMSRMGLWKTKVKGGNKAYCYDIPSSPIFIPSSIGIIWELSVLQSVASNIVQTKWKREEYWVIDFERKVYIIFRAAKNPP